MIERIRWLLAAGCMWISQRFQLFALKLMPIDTTPMQRLLQAEDVEELQEAFDNFKDEI